MPPRRRYQQQSRIIRAAPGSRNAYRNYSKYRVASSRRRYRRSSSYASRAASALGSVVRGAGRLAYRGTAAVLNNPLTRAAAVEMGRRAAANYYPGVAGAAHDAAMWGLGQIVGHGDYQVKANSLMGLGGSSVDSLPTFVASKNGVRIVHREYLGEITSSSTPGQFQIQKFPIQPGYSFPWLAPIAVQFQQYRINGMVFEYKTMSSDALNSTNTALGNVILSTQYVVTTPDPVAASQMYQMDFTSSTKPSLSVMHPIECAPQQSKFLLLDVRNGPTSSFSNDDLRLYDYANFFIATQGFQGASVDAGQLWVSYDISFYKPILGASIDVGDHFVLPASINSTHFFGTTIPAASNTSDLGSFLSYDGSNNGNINIPEYYIGNLAVIYTVYGGTSTASAMNPTIVGNGTNILPLNMINGGNVIQTAGTSSATVITISLFTVSGGGGQIQLEAGSGTLPASITGGQLFVVSWPTTLET